MELCEERDSTGSTVIKRFFGQGEQISGTNYFFMRDHIGNVREMTDASGYIKARYEFDPYGGRTKVSGTMEADFGFTGHYVHAVSGLHLALYRAYDAEAGRWLNRDPIGEAGGINLYTYVENNPVNGVDPLGLWNLWNPATWGDANPNGWSVWNSLTPWHESSGYTWEGIKWNTGQAAQATLDGIIPFADPFKDNGGYDPCDKSLAWSRHLGAFSRDVYLGARIPNLTQWLNNPWLYEAGSATVPTRVFNMIEGLSPVWRGRWLGAFGETFGPYGAREMAAAYARTWNTGFTPGGRLLLELIPFSVTDTLMRLSQ